jgi:hypothetical protein
VAGLAGVAPAGDANAGCAAMAPMQAPISTWATRRDDNTEVKGRKRLELIMQSPRDGPETGLERRWGSSI